jgi:L-ascorbate metabolism protein UlaG (beta-lactamase superfamily)
MKICKKTALSVFILSLVLGCILPLAARVSEPHVDTEKSSLVSDHFDGNRYFNPHAPQSPPSPPGQAFRWLWKWVFRTNFSTWPRQTDFLPEAPPVGQASDSSLFITAVGHGTFLIQMDGVNILTDPIWSERCSPFSWVGPKRKHEPGIRFEDLPAIDVALVSHNHYDHLDLPTLKRLAEKGMPRAVVPLGNISIMERSGIPNIDELDWWESVTLNSKTTITLVPAQHFSGRTLWDRNKSLWGGFIISGPSGNVFYSGDTGYGPHFREIAYRFSPIRVALLPISPFRPSQPGDPTQEYRRVIHMGPADAIQAHLDLGTPVSIAAHFQVFQLGFDGFHDAVDALAASLEEHGMEPNAFVAPMFGRAISIPPIENVPQPGIWETQNIWRTPTEHIPMPHGFTDIAIPLRIAPPEQLLPRSESAVQ